MTQLQRQIVFDIAAEALLKQGKKSCDVDGDLCLYRGPNGVRCAIGHLIPDAQYSPMMEGEPVRSLPVIEITNKGSVIKLDDLDFLARLQNDIHDRVDECSFVGDLKEAVSKFAETHCLDIPTSFKE